MKRQPRPEIPMQAQPVTIKRDAALWSEGDINRVKRTLHRARKRHPNEALLAFRRRLSMLVRRAMEAENVSASEMALAIKVNIDRVVDVMEDRVEFPCEAALLILFALGLDVDARTLSDAFPPADVHALANRTRLHSKRVSQWSNPKSPQRRSAAARKNLREEIRQRESIGLPVAPELREAVRLPLPYPRRRAGLARQAEAAGPPPSPAPEHQSSGPGRSNPERTASIPAASDPTDGCVP